MRANDWSEQSYLIQHVISMVRWLKDFRLWSNSALANRCLEIVEIGDLRDKDKYPTQMLLRPAQVGSGLRRRCSGPRPKKEIPRLGLVS
jgi:hypothetical protein